jgi:hypothetical protein
VTWFHVMSFIKALLISGSHGGEDDVDLLAL